MNLSTGQRLICDRVINVFETGTLDGDYGEISVYHDGPGDARQITYGRSQTTEFGNLRKLVEMYAEAGGLYSRHLAAYVQRIGKVPLVDDAEFKQLLRLAGEEDSVMRATQDSFFDKVYFEPSRRWAESHGFLLPLSMLVIYDSFIHSGGIRDDLRWRFDEATPAAGGDERAWISRYVEVRHDWLSHHRRPAVKSSAYRTRDLLREIQRNNWELDLLPIVANGTPVDAVKGPAPRVPESAAPASMTRETAQATSANGADTLRRLALEAGVLPAMDRMLSYREKFRPGSDPRYWAVVNFDLHSSKPRLFLFDRVAAQLSHHLCAHGQGSDSNNDGMAEMFSNVDGSHCTSLGIHHCDLTYIGGSGKSLYLDGLEATNSASRARHIVMHGAKYVSPAMVEAKGVIGLSHGCPAIEMDEVEFIIPKLMGGSLLIHWRSPG